MGVREPLWVSVVTLTLTLKTTTMETKFRFCSDLKKADVHLWQEFKGRMVSVTDFQFTSELGNNNVKTSAPTSKGF